LSWRLPRGISSTVERSKCSSCGHILGVRDLVPVFSWLFLKGRCHFCRAPIGWRYPLIELVTLALCLAFYERFGFSASTLLLICLAPVVVSAAAIDFEHQILPDSLNAALALIGIAVLCANAWEAGNPSGFIMEHGAIALEGALIYGLGSIALRFGVMAVLKKDPLGWGDIKFFAAAGFWLGTDPMTCALFLTASGCIGVAIALVWRKIVKDPEFPFGPALLAAFVTMLLLRPPEFIFQ
jgi:leader peptidase (prepilin peptidase)/N-methyltransferase